MRISRRIIGLSVLACLLLSALIAAGVFGVGSQQAVAAEPTDIGHYFYNQLTDEQKHFYKAMEEMHDKGLFVKGEDYDLVANNHVTQAQLDSYANGSSELINVLGAARDAFYTDYNDIFYVDFGYLSLRVTQDGSGKYHAYLGSGRADTYWMQGFENEQSVRAAITEYNNALKDAVTASKAAKPTASGIKALGDEKLAAQVAQIREAHRQVAKSTVYRLETEAGDNAGHVRTPYGALVKGVALCEGYSRAFKAIMDELGVPCVLVNGVYRHGNNQEELHMWTYVKLLDGSWYAVDPTFDDINFDDKEKWPADKYPGLAKRTTPLDEIPNQFKDEEKEEDSNSVYDKELGIFYNEDYFLKGAAYMNTQHATSPYKSEAEYPFTYPKLSEQNIGGEISLAHGMFKVVQTPYDGALNSTNIYVSVLIDGEWCGYAEAEAKGYYILIRHEGNYLPEKLAGKGDLSHVDDKDKDIVNTSLVWGYLNPIRDPEPMYPNIKEGVGYTVIEDESKSTGFEFALTTRAPRPYDWDDRYGYTADEAAEMLTFTGDMSMFVARSGVIQTKFGDPDYQPAPHVLRSTPAHTGRLSIGYSYNITVEYDQVLQFMNGATELQMSVYGMRATGEILKGTHAVVLSKVVDMSSIKYDLGEQLEDGTYRCGSISFRFTPDEEWAFDSVMYYFNFNLEGVNSHKQVNPATFTAAHECEALCYRAYGYHWSIFGQPKLMEDEDLSKSGWVTSDNTDVSKSKDRLALVVTRPSQKQNDTMMDMIEDEFDENILESFTYNITLTICKSIILETGQGVRVCVGFPEGFTYNDSMNGVTFKAYHFKRDAWDKITGVEEIECTVTPLGLILLCKSFSPFAIVAAESDASAEVSADKTVILTNSNGGNVCAETVKDGETKNLFKLKAGETRNVTVKAHDGYVIEMIKINGSAVKTNYETTKTLTLKYDELIAQNIVEVNFVAESVKKAEEERGETPVVQQLRAAEISVVKKVSAKVGEQLKIESTVTAYGDANLYQWYKNGVAIAGQTGKTLLIESAEKTDKGNYTLQVTSLTGSTTVKAESSVVKVSVTGQSSLSTAEKVSIVISIIGVCAVGIFIAVLMNMRKPKQKKSKKSKGE